MRITMTDPASLKELPPSWQSEWRSIQQRSLVMYREAIKRGMKREDAQYILPSSCKEN